MRTRTVEIRLRDICPGTPYEMSECPDRTCTCGIWCEEMIMLDAHLESLPWTRGILVCHCGRFYESFMCEVCERIDGAGRGEDANEDAHREREEVTR